MKLSKSEIEKTLKGSVLFKFFRIARTSMSLGIILSLLFFLYNLNASEKKSRDLVKNLTKLEQSLSTRYLGIFPNYMTQIDEFFANADPEEPVIIFEDVLYYGCLSGPREFKKVIYRLLEMADQGCKITIVHYDIDGRIFHRIIQEGRFRQPYLGKLDKERRELISELRRQENNNGENQNIYLKADSIVSEKYLALTDRNEIKKSVDRYLKPLYDSEHDKDSLFYILDEAKRKALDKPVQQIRYHDFLDMYRNISHVLIDCFTEHNIELIGLNEYLTMSCWMNNDKAIVAFPSKFNTDEIGFYTQDQVFLKYINTMLEGVKE
jgi:hypothetical protein